VVQMLRMRDYHRCLFSRRASAAESVRLQSVGLFAGRVCEVVALPQKINLLKHGIPLMKC
jgi:hypothetical protein